MATSIQFRAALSRYKKTRLDPLAKAARDEMGAELAHNLVRGCPVLTGRTRANMQVTTGTQGGEVPIEDPEGSATIERMTADVAAAPAASRLTFYNPVPWMPKLDAGSSRQAPLGVFRVALRQLRASMPALMARVRRRLGGQFIVR